MQKCVVNSVFHLLSILHKKRHSVVKVFLMHTIHMFELKATRWEKSSRATSFYRKYVCWKYWWLFVEILLD